MDKQPLVLVVEDEPNIAEVELAYLRNAGWRTGHLERGDGAVDWIRAHSPDLVVLDLMLPGKDGTDICRELRGFSAVPVIMVTARVEEIDRLLGFDVGADDYLCKPFSPKELVARAGALLRRSGALQPSGKAPRFAVDRVAMRISCQGQALDLTPQEYRLLEVLIGHPGRVFSRAQLLELAYDDSAEVFDRAIDSHVKNVRKKVAAVLGEETVIHSVYGVGYRFEVE
ncbi:MAG: two-component system response regulator BaeR [Moraxellaceae bacterium]|jgi:two-component system response regulator BaeR|nr:two-component system response regulator BaeR [Moraxellaceae bacterium]